MSLVMELGCQRKKRLRVGMHGSCPAHGEIPDARIILKDIKPMDVVSNNGARLTQDVLLHMLTEPRRSKVATDIHAQACRDGSEFNLDPAVAHP